MSSVNDWCASKRLQLNTMKIEVMWYVSKPMNIEVMWYGSKPMKIEVMWCGSKTNLGKLSHGDKLIKI